MTDETHPALEASDSFEHLRLGRRELRHDPLTLRLASYLDDARILPDVPDEADWTLGVRSWPMYENDNLGDCTFATVGHLIQSWTAAVGKPVTPTVDEIVAGYWATGSSDDGRVEVDVLNFWRHVGVAGHRIEAYAYVNPRNLDHVRAAIYLFGGVYTGIALPTSAQKQNAWDVADASLAGDAAPGSWGGHAVPYHAYGAGRFRCSTWGGLLDLSEAFHLAYTDELYAIISTDWLDERGGCPAGLAMDDLRADLRHLRQR